MLDRLEARTTLIAEGAARDEAEAIAALVGSEMDARGVGLEEIAKRKYAAPAAAVGPRRSQDQARARAARSDGARRLRQRASAPSEPGTVFELAPIAARGEVVGSVRVVKPTIAIRRVLEDFAPFILVVSLVLGVTAALAADFSPAARIARPIEALTDFAGRVSEGERRAAPAARPTGARCRASRVAIDSMRRQLEGRPFVETFAADLSHELKNPVAAIRASAEVLADGALDEPEEAARFVGRIREATTRIEALLGDLSEPRAHRGARRRRGDACSTSATLAGAGRRAGARARRRRRALRSRARHRRGPRRRRAGSPAPSTT